MHCKRCEEDRKYSERWDAYYCEKCDFWLSARCAKHSECPIHCHLRPKKPSERLESDKGLLNVPDC